MPNQNVKQNNDALAPVTENKAQNKEKTHLKEQDKCPIKLDTLQDYWNLMKQHYTRKQRKMKIWHLLVLQMKREV